MTGVQTCALPIYWGINHSTIPTYDGANWNASYRNTCTANAWAGFVLAAHIMDAKSDWNHNALFDYMDRYMQKHADLGNTGTWYRQWNRFTEDMWDTYRANYGSIWTADSNSSAPALVAIGNKSVNENSALTFTVSATDADGNTITYSAQDLPSGATFASQSFSWTPTYEQAGDYNVTFIASDGQAQDSETITITVTSIDGPVGYWKFDDVNGTSAADSSGNSNTATLVNGPAWTTGRIDGALSFDGVDDAVEIPTANWDVNNGTVSLWAYAESFSASHYLFGHTTQPVWANRIQIYTDDTYLGLGLGDSHSRHINIQDLDAHTWYHITLTWDGTNYAVYVNGDSKATGTYAGLSTLETYADIGNNGNSSDRTEAFNGIIDEVRAYNRALTADEVLSLFNEVGSLVFDPIGDKQVDAGTELTFEVNTPDPNTVVDINDHNLPTDPLFFSNIFAWTPGLSDAGSYEVTFEAPDGNFIDFETITITVNTSTAVDGLVGHWKMNDNGASTIVADSSGTNNDGTAQQNTSTLSTTGKINGAFTFNGTGDYISVPDRDEWTLNNDFTIMVWVKFDTLNSHWWESALVAHDEGGGQTNKWIFSYDPGSSRTLLHINIPNVKGEIIEGNSWIAQAGTWYFIGLSRSGDTYTFYRNGVSDGSEINATQIPNAAAPLTIGWAEGDKKFDGAMDNVMIFNKALSRSEIEALYNGGAGTETF